MCSDWLSVRRLERSVVEMLKKHLVDKYFLSPLLAIFSPFWHDRRIVRISTLTMFIYCMFAVFIDSRRFAGAVVCPWIGVQRVEWTLGSTAHFVPFFSFSMINFATVRTYWDEVRAQHVETFTNTEKCVLRSMPWSGSSSSALFWAIFASTCLKNTKGSLFKPSFNNSKPVRKISERAMSAAFAMDLCMRFAYRRSASSFAISRLITQSFCKARGGCTAESVGTGFCEGALSLIANAFLSVSTVSSSCFLILGFKYNIQNMMLAAFCKMRSGLSSIGLNCGLLPVVRVVRFS